MNVWTLDCDVVFCKPISVFRFDWVETFSQRPYAFGLGKTDIEWLRSLLTSFSSVNTHIQGRRNDFFLRGAHFIRKTKFC